MESGFRPDPAEFAANVQFLCRKIEISLARPRWPWGPCGQQPVASTIWAMVAPPLRSSMAFRGACLVPAACRPDALWRAPERPCGAARSAPLPRPGLALRPRAGLRAAVSSASTLCTSGSMPIAARPALVMMRAVRLPSSCVRYTGRSVGREIKRLRNQR